MSKSKYRWIELGDGRKVYAKPPEFIPNHFGDAPMVMFDSMPEEYHHGVCRPISSRKEWQEADKVSGSATISGSEWQAKRERIPKLKAAAERELQKDRRKASLEALRSARENPTEFEGRLKKRAEEQEQIAKESKLEPLIKGAM